VHPSKKILILGGPGEEHGRFVHDQLRLRGAQCYYLDIRSFPKEIRVNYYPVTNDGEIILAGDTVCRFEDINSVYWRNYNRIASMHGAPIRDAEMAFIAENDSRGLAESLLMGLETRWVNGWEGFELHQRKPYALSLIARLGIRVPRTICSNDPSALKEFAFREQDVIFKPIQGGTHTERLRRDRLTDANLIGLELAPVTFQEEIPGTDIRVFVAGDRCHALEVRTPELDFRDDPRPEIFPVELPPAVAEQSVTIARTLKLLWTGIDYRLTPDGEYVFLEANPSPMFMGFEKATGVPLTAALLDLLTA
jgi:glutathione synthase/RimK-type ligase-like ATP-grasp enzyme